MKTYANIWKLSNTLVSKPWIKKQTNKQKNQSRKIFSLNNNENITHSH